MTRHQQLQARLDRMMRFRAAAASLDERQLANAVVGAVLCQLKAITHLHGWPAEFERVGLSSSTACRLMRFSRQYQDWRNLLELL